MAVLSVLRQGLCRPYSFLKNAVRKSGSYDPRKMYIHPSKRSFQKANDMIHFYTFLGVFPLTLLACFVNVTVGPATLVPIPEGYEPKHWEYYRNPICRWFARVVYKPPQEDYEKLLHFKWIHHEKREMKMIDQKVEQIRRRRQDSEDDTSFMRIPTDHIWRARKHYEHLNETKGYGSDGGEDYTGYDSDGRKK